MNPLDSSVAVLSHGWLAAHHPDPACMRIGDVKQVYKLYLFWDFMSLFQIYRTEEQTKSFRVALASMHNVYGHGRWPVYRLITIPTDAFSDTAYLARGWCFFESCVASVGADQVISIEHGENISGTTASPMPLRPEEFSVKIQSLRFTSARADKQAVFELYARIFPRLAEHTHMFFYAWGDDEVEQLLAVLPVLTGLYDVTIWNNLGSCTARISAEAERKLYAALRSRGGRLRLHQDADDVFINTVDIATMGVEQVTSWLLRMPGLRRLTHSPTTPASLVLFLEAANAAVVQGGLEEVREFVPDNNEYGVYSTEAWPLLMSLCSRLDKLERITLKFECGDQDFPCDAEARAFAKLLESDAMPKLTKLNWRYGKGHGEGWTFLHQVAATKGVELDVGIEHFDVTAKGVERMTSVLLHVPWLRKLTHSPATPAALVLFLEAMNASVIQGGLKEVREFIPDNTEDGVYTAEAWPMLMSLCPRLNRLQTLTLSFDCREKSFPCDAEARAFAELLESGAMPKLTELDWWDGTGHGEGCKFLRRVAEQRGIELDLELPEDSD